VKKYYRGFQMCAKQRLFTERVKVIVCESHYKFTANLPIDARVLGVKNFDDNILFVDIDYYSETKNDLVETNFLLVNSITPNKLFDEYECLNSIKINGVDYYVFLEVVYLTDNDNSDSHDDLVILNKIKFNRDNLKINLDNLSLSKFTKYDENIHNTSESLKSLSNSWRNELGIFKVMDILDIVIESLTNLSNKTDELIETIYEDNKIKLTKTFDVYSGIDYYVHFKHMGRYVCVLKPHEYITDNDVDLISFVPNSWIEYLKELGYKAVDKIAYEQSEIKYELFSEEEVYSCMLAKVLYNRI
jgi:hypothetical protein